MLTRIVISETSHALPTDLTCCARASATAHQQGSQTIDCNTDTMIVKLHCIASRQQRAGGWTAIGCTALTNSVQQHTKAQERQQDRLGSHFTPSSTQRAVRQMQRSPVHSLHLPQRNRAQINCSNTAEASPAAAWTCWTKGFVAFCQSPAAAAAACAAWAARSAKPLRRCTLRRRG